MTSSRTHLVAGALLAGVAACAPPHATAPVPEPSPAPATPPVVTESVPPSPPAQRRLIAGSWAFTYTPGTFTYLIDDSTRVTGVPDTTPAHSVAPLMGSVVVQIAPGGVAQPVTPALPDSTAPCDSTTRPLALRAATIIPTLPPMLTAGATWSDSSTSSGCRGPVLATVVTRSRYVVAGGTSFGGARAVLVQRVDSLVVTGDGSEGQHRIHIAGVGHGSSDLFLDPARGLLLHATGNQDMTLDVTTSGRTSRFLQHTDQRATLVSPP